MNSFRRLRPILLAGTACISFALQGQEAKPGTSAVVAEMIEPLISKWKDTYQKKTPAFDLTLTSTLQDSVFKAFQSGQSLMAPSAREFSADEISTFTAKWGYAPTRVAVCQDALVVLVNKSNPLKEIKVEQLDAIYSTTRLQGWPKDIKTWGDLGLTNANWAARPIEIFAHPEGSGTRQYFIQAIQKNGKSKLNIRRGSDILAMIEDLTTNQAGIGYGSVSQSYSSLRTVPVIPIGGKTPVEATPAMIAEGAYPLGRTLYIYLNRAPGKPLNPNILGFVRFALSKEGQDLVRTTGFAPLSADIAAINSRRLNATN